jgi:Asp-tRNA(Asn)/Glu-tRNA(Gln) amidotransferase A subunit family amidase
MSHEPITRRDILKQGAMAGAAITFMNPTNAALDYEKYDGLGLAELIRKKQITPTELLHAVRQRLEAVNPKLNAFAALFFDKAEAAIKAGLPDGPFKGVPFALKDLGMNLTGTVTTYGSRVWKNNLAQSDSTLVARYKNAGLVIFGKTTSPELGLTTTTESVAFGKTRNPWNLEHTSGGSSGGASSAVAARIIPMGHASDGGGSIRIPASCCGLFGLKPTRGRIPMGPAAMEGWNGCSAHHAVTISVRDSAALLDSTHGTELGSPYTCPPPARPFLKEVGVDPSKLRIAYAPAPPGGVAVDPECKQAAADAAKLCESLGHRVDETTLPIDNAFFRQSFLTVITVSMARALEDAASILGHAVTENDVEAATWAMYQQGKQISSVVYSRSIANMHQVGLTMAKWQEKYDVILSPTLAKPPVKLGVLSLDDPARYGKEVSEFSPFTALYNVTGQPSMSVPLHWTRDGLPVGVMFSARFGDEATLFRLAAQLEKAKPWVHRKPTV